MSKKVSSGYAINKEKYEFEDIARIARKRNMCLADVTDYIKKTEK